jgi:hypothetical protein
VDPRLVSRRGRVAPPDRTSVHPSQGNATTATESVGRQLPAAAADLGACGGFLAFDAGEQTLARRLLTEAVLLSGSAGDPTITAQAYLTMALQSTSLARLSGKQSLAREALRFLDQAADLTRHTPSPKLHALIWMRKATAAALLDDGPAAREGIARAKGELGRGPHPHDPYYCGFVTSSEIVGHEARVATDQGKHETAALLYRQVLDDVELPTRNETYYRSLLSATLLDAGDTSGAVDEGLKVLPALEGPITSIRPFDELRSVRNAAPDEEFADRYDALARAMAVK